MRFVSDIAVGLACFSAGAAVLFHLFRREPALAGARRAAWLAFVGLFCFGLSRVLDAFALLAPASPLMETLDIVSVGVALTLSLACWGLVPGLSAAPFSGDLMKEKAGLERAVAERTGALARRPLAAIDAAEHRRRRDELAPLLRELTHRTLNLLAVIQGIARQSSRSATDVQGFVHNFNGRLRALALTHELLVETQWRGVEMRRLIAAVSSAAAPVGGESIVLRGPSCVLSPACAQNLALAVHEMAVIADSHVNGLRDALDVDISWVSVAIGGFAGVELSWREKGPLAKIAPRREFGLILVEDLLSRAVDGRSSIAYDDEGLLWTLRIDNTQLQLRA